MYIQCMLGAIFIIFILCVHCDNSVNYNESKEIYGEYNVKLLLLYRFGALGVLQVSHKVNWDVHASLLGSYLSISSPTRTLDMLLIAIIIT